MPELSIDLLVAAPADQVWDVIGHRFDRIGDWATAITASTAIPTPRSLATRTTAAVSVPAPVAGRVCQTGVRLVGEITETLTAYDDAGRTLAYQATGMPAFVTLGRNTWSVVPVDDTTCRLELRARFDTHGLLGLLGRWAILAQTRRTSHHLADDLHHYIETGEPSPRKKHRQRADRQ
jgi:hypothetical protein